MSFRRIPKLLTKLAILTIFSTALAHTILSTFVSYHNYPGGVAMLALHDMIAQNASLSTVDKIQVHIDAYSAMTGASLFTQLDRNQVFYDRNESTTDFTSFDYLVVHDFLAHEDFDIGAAVWGYAGMERRMVMDKMRLPVPVYAEQVWVLKKRAAIP